MAAKLTPKLVARFADAYEIPGERNTTIHIQDNKKGINMGLTLPAFTPMQEAQLLATPLPRPGRTLQGMGSAFKIGRAAGIDVKVHWTFFLLTGLPGDNLPQPATEEVSGD